MKKKYYKMKNLKKNNLFRFFWTSVTSIPDRSQDKFTKY